MWCLSVLELELFFFSHSQNIDEITLSKSYFSLSMLSRKDDLYRHKTTFFTWQTDNNCLQDKNQNPYVFCFQNYYLLPLDIIIALRPFRPPGERRSMVPLQDQNGTLVQTWRLMHHTPSKRSILRNLDLSSCHSNGNDYTKRRKTTTHTWLRPGRNLMPLLDSSYAGIPWLFGWGDSTCLPLFQSWRQGSLFYWLWSDSRTTSGTVMLCGREANGRLRRRSRYVNCVKKLRSP